MKTEGEKYRMLINALEAVMDTIIVHREISTVNDMHKMLYHIERLTVGALKELEK